MDFDVIIIGSGPVGLSFARALSDSDLTICILEQNNELSLSKPKYDGREVALTHLSKKIMSELEIWDRIDPDSISYIKEAKVLNGMSPYSLHFNHEETSENALGHLIPNHEIKTAVYESITDVNNITLLTEIKVESFSINDSGVSIELNNGEILTSNLLIAADGRLSNARRAMGIPSEVKDFGKTVIVCKMDHEEAHNNTAYECFHYGRTLAVLPMAGQCSSIVITISSDKAKEIIDMPDEQFNLDIQTRFRDKLGEMKLIGDKYSYPLFASHADYFHSERFALIGDAAVGMHPVTAHGFNLGLRGAYNLSKIIKLSLTSNQNYYSIETLSEYNRKHQLVTRPLYYGTNLIVDLYNSDRVTAKMLRRLALRFGNNFWPVKKLIMNQLTETN
ncbi:MAG: 5-demethoxyubiquinol-8 5-hydroxylase UbiM [Gammaproteobacteria bacterium]|jgi:ubiquinone biosynthesis UbiH/UbiF/VisC/COQ6 family hydroxylase|nr:5-demethoxyubiquinol-8 5-hydroxylase UbiM [Gammaproteobacteria bacterium]